jgi:hypothetical protein
MITTAAELHRYLSKLKNFDFSPAHDRDHRLYLALKARLGLDDGEFLTALDRKNVSAEAYLRALIHTAEPLAAMYKAIVEYCEEAHFLRSRESTEVQWESEVGKQTLELSLEAFRKYIDIVRQLSGTNKPCKQLIDTKNKLMDWLADEVFAPSHKGLVSHDWDWKGVELFRILDDACKRHEANCPAAFGGLKRCYIGGARRHPSPPDAMKAVTSNPQYKAILKEVALVFGDLDIEQVASAFVELPFWKFRWQVYELWTITVVLRELTSVGFELVRSVDGDSMLELGKVALLATHPASGQVLTYQPTYWNRQGKEIHPDLVISRTNTVTADNTLLIVECKQRLTLESAHITEVGSKYAQGVDATHGQVVIINYDEDGTTDSSTIPVRFIPNVRPGGMGEHALLEFLLVSHVWSEHLEELWYVDVSMSMRDKLPKRFLDFLSARHAKYRTRGYVELYRFALQVEAAQPHELEGNVPLSPVMADENWEGHGIDALRDHLKEKTARLGHPRVFVISDLSSTFDDLQTRIGPVSNNITWLNPDSEDLSMSFFGLYKAGVAP